MSVFNAHFFRQQCYINGCWVDASDQQSAQVTDPATGDIIAQVPLLPATDLEACIVTAEKAGRKWTEQSAEQRSRLLKKWYQLVLEHQPELAELMTREQGKPLTESAAEIAYAASYIEWFAEEALRVQGDIQNGPSADKRSLIIRQPIGLCAAITPWNFPAAMLTRKIAPALAAGCSIIVKPALETPLSALALAALAEQAGIPAGVLNVVTGDGPTLGRVLTQSNRVRKLSFTGSTQTGSLLMAASAQHVQKVSLELGGNAPFIVFADADIERAVKGAIESKFRNAGQTCVCANRIYVHHSIHDEFMQRFKEATQQLVVGNGLKTGTQIGPLINREAVNKVNQQIEDALSKGAKLICGGPAVEADGLWFQPTILTDMQADMRCAQEETFGPLAPIFKFTDDAEVITQANATPFGLAAYFYTQNIDRMWRVAEQLEVGMVGVNTGIISSASAPFGGVKSSGIGREGSRFGLDEYTELKYICLELEGKA